MDKTIYPNTWKMPFFILQTRMSHTPGESRDSEMSEEEIIEVGFICSVHAHTIIMITVTRNIRWSAAIGSSEISADSWYGGLYWSPSGGLLLFVAQLYVPYLQEMICEYSGISINGHSQ